MSTNARSLLADVLREREICATNERQKIAREVQRMTRSPWLLALQCACLVGALFTAFIAGSIIGAIVRANATLAAAEATHQQLLDKEARVDALWRQLEEIQREQAVPAPHHQRMTPDAGQVSRL